jgi:uncharacterized membrane protein YqjE
MPAPAPAPARTPTIAAQPVIQVEDVELVEDAFEDEPARVQETSPQRASLQTSLSNNEKAPAAPQEPASTPTANATTENAYNLMDDHEQLVSWGIHLALILFGGLVCLSVLLAFLVIHKYGFIAISALAIVVLFFVGLALFVSYILKQDARLEPVRRRLQGFAEIFQKMVHDEMGAFKFEWGQYLLLTDGDAGTAVPNDQEDDQANATPSIPEPKKKKSIVFRMIKPFLKARKRVFGRKSKKRKDTEMTSTTSYEPPTTTATAATTVEYGVPV